MIPRIDIAEDAFRAGDADAALRHLVDGFTALLSPSSPVHREAIGWSPADDLCRRIGASLPASPPPLPDVGDLDLYVATQLYPGGGHTAVIGDFVQATPSGNTALLLTRTVEGHIHPEPTPPPEVIARTGIPLDRVFACPQPGGVAAVRWIAGEMSRLRPRRVFLFHHPQDAPLIAALQPAVLPPAGAYLVHHADRQPSAGLHAPGVQLVDLTPFTAEYSRRILLRPSLYAPLTVRDTCPGPRPPFLRGPGGRLTTLSSGSAHKFGPEYPHVISRVLALTGGRHVHVGHLPRARLDALRETLESQGIGPDRFLYVKWVPSLARAIWDLGADLMIGSMPMGGARTAIEASCSGTPAFHHFPPSTVPFGVRHVTPDFPLWKDPETLLDLLSRVDRAWLEAAGATARDNFEKHHHPDHLREALENLERGITLPLPKTVDRPEELCHLDRLEAALVGEWAPFRSEMPGLPTLQESPPQHRFGESFPESPVESGSDTPN